MMAWMKEVVFEGRPYKVSFDAMPMRLKEELGESALERYLELLQKVQIAPKKVYKEVLAFSEKHMDVAEVINLLTFAHIQNHKIVEAEKLIEATYKAHPEYLFARINYADQCVRKKKWDKIGEVFPTFDLEELYPGKRDYHASEFRGFLVMMAHYHRAKKEQPSAMHYLEAAKEVEPNHPSVVYLERKLMKRSLFDRFFRNNK